MHVSAQVVSTPLLALLHAVCAEYYTLPLRVQKVLQKVLQAEIRSFRASVLFCVVLWYCNIQCVGMQCSIYALVVLLHAVCAQCAQYLLNECVVA
jgi:hypothetical protein